MPQAPPPPAPVPPFPLKDWEVLFIKETVERFYGKDVVVRNFGPEPSSLEIHVEKNADAGMERHECLGILMAKISRDRIDLTVTKRGTRIFGKARIAYRQGVII